jgi:hypothetical protein
VTYWINPPVEPDPALTFGKYSVEHPQYNTAACSATPSIRCRCILAIAPMANWR